MKRMLKRIFSVRKKEKELKKVKDEPARQRLIEAEKTTALHDEDMEEPVGGDRASFLRRPSQILPDNPPFLRSYVRYKTWSYRRLSTLVKLHNQNWNISDIEKGTTIRRSKSMFISHPNDSTQVASLPDTRLKEFTPDVTLDESDDETYLFQCSCAGLYQCSVTGLVFDMQGEGDVVYRTVPWNRRLLAQHHKKPAGPLFDIKCQQQSVCQLHLPHCEVISTGGGQFLQVAHLKDEGIELMIPHQITETHVVINIKGFSAYGIVKDDDAPLNPVQALVLLFYKPPDADPRSVLSVFMLPRNIVFHKFLRDRKKSDKSERYIETSPYCKLHPTQVYTLSTDPEHDLIKVQPKEADFDEEHHDSYFPSFQVVLKKVLTDINLSLRDKSSSSCVWEREFCLLATEGETGPKKTPSDVRSCFIKSISAPVLSSLLDKLLDKKVITYAEREAADIIQNRSERARCVFDTVCNKGEAASLQMMKFLHEEDPFLSEHLGLKQNGEVAHGNDLPNSHRP